MLWSFKRGDRGKSATGQFISTGFIICLAALSFATSVSVAGTQTCEILFKNRNLKSRPEILNHMTQQDDSAAEMDRALVKSTLGSKLDAPITMSESMKSFRARVLPDLLGNKDRREAMIRLSEAQIRVRSEILAEKIAQDVNVNYDIVIQGAGVHSAILAATLKFYNPKIRILIVEVQDTLGSNFRLLADMIRLNSTVRASGQGRALPREGNVNLLPFLPLQVSDLSSVRFPHAGDLGESLIAAYHALNSMDGVDILLSTEAKSNQNNALQKNANVSLLRNNKILGIARAYRSVKITGLPKTKIPPAIASFIRANPEVALVDGNRLPLISTYESAMYQLASSNNPAAITANRKLGVAGKGDGGKTFLEAVAGINENRSLSNAEVGQPSFFFLFGWDTKTCEDWQESARSRYNQLGSLFDSTKTGRPGRAKGFDAKVRRVEKSATGRGLKVFLEDGTTQEVDHLILATGSDIPTVDSNKYTLIEDQVANFGLANIALFDPGTNTYVAGPGAGNLNPDFKLFNVNENFVAIFRNAPLVVKLGERLAEEVKGMNNGPYFESPQYRENKIVASSPSGSIFRVENIANTRTFGAGNIMQFMRATFDFAISNLEVDSVGSLEVQIKYESSTKSLLVKSPSHRIDNLVEVLVSTKDFFNVSALILSGQPADAILKINISNSIAKIQLVRVDSSTSSNDSLPSIANGSLHVFAPLKNKTSATQTPTGPMETSPQSLDDGTKSTSPISPTSSTSPNRVATFNTRIDKNLRPREFDFPKQVPLDRNPRGENSPKRYSQPLDNGTIATAFNRKASGNRTITQIDFQKNGNIIASYNVEGELATKIGPFGKPGEGLYQLSTKQPGSKEAREEYIVRVPRNESESLFIWQPIPLGISIENKLVAEYLETFRRNLEKGSYPRVYGTVSTLISELARLERKISADELLAILNTISIDGPLTNIVSQKNIRYLFKYRFDILEIILTNYDIISTESLTQFLKKHLKYAFSTGRLIPRGIEGIKATEKGPYEDLARAIITTRLVKEQTAQIQTDFLLGTSSRDFGLETLFRIPTDIIDSNYAYENGGLNRPDTRLVAVTPNGIGDGTYRVEVKIESRGIARSFQFYKPVKKIFKFLNRQDILLIQFADDSIAIVNVLTLFTNQLADRVYEIPNMNIKSLPSDPSPFFSELKNFLQLFGSSKDANFRNIIESDVFAKTRSLPRNLQSITPEKFLLFLQIAGVDKILSGSPRRPIFDSLRNGLLDKTSEKDFEARFNGQPIAFYRDVLRAAEFLTYSEQLNNNEIEKRASAIFGFKVKANKDPNYKK